MSTKDIRQVQLKRLLLKPRDIGRVVCNNNNTTQSSFSTELICRELGGLCWGERVTPTPTGVGVLLFLDPILTNYPLTKHQAGTIIYTQLDADD